MLFDGAKGGGQKIPYDSSCHLEDATSRASDMLSSGCACGRGLPGCAL